jgi:integrase
MAARWGPVRLVTETVRIRSVFEYGIDNGLIEIAVRYGSEFKPPSRSALRRHRAAAGPRMLEAEELRRLIDAANPTLRAMILLEVNTGLGNSDCAELLDRHIDLGTGWLDYPRPKTGIPRRCPLWSEAVTVIRESIGKRPHAASRDDPGTCSSPGSGTGEVATVKPMP